MKKLLCIGFLVVSGCASQDVIDVQVDEPEPVASALDEVSIETLSLVRYPDCTDRQLDVKVRYADLSTLFSPRVYFTSEGVCQK